LIVIGAGPGGYNCAIRAAQLGMSCLVVEKRSSRTLGGTCLNVGCIPSKALLHASEAFAQAQDHMSKMGVKTKGVELDLKAMMQFKDAGVKGLTQGVEFLFKKNKIDHVFGTGMIEGKGRVHVTKLDGGSESYQCRNIVLATGSEVATLPGVEIDEERIVSSTGAIALKQVPRHLVIVGAGYIGLELGSVWRRLGARVTVLEYLDRITPGLDSELSRQFQRILGRQGLAFKLGTRVTAVENGKDGVTVSVEGANGGGGETIKADVVLMAVGRRPYTKDIGLENAGIEPDRYGRIPTDAHYRTTAEGVYAIGDVIEGPMLAHKAEDEAMAVAEIIAGKAGHVNYDVIPSVIYTYPEVASVGRTEEQLKEAGIEYRAGKFPFTANPRAKANDMTEGFAKILADARTDEVLGVHLMGPHAGEMIAGAAIAMEFGAAAEDIARTCHPHPTFTEAIRQAAMGIDGRIMQM
ncbi:MAG: dihydrolipoyl dehydrogenase, partial [Alphaproteobacteria bacterium]